MDHHGWEFVVYCLIRLYEVSVWPVFILALVYIFRESCNTGLEAIMKKIGDLIEIRAMGGSAKFRRPEKVTPPPMNVEEKP
jgi:hypothetical protein